MSNLGIVNFNSGELDPKVDVRKDLEKYTGGCRRLDNMIPDLYGNATRRPGTTYVTSSNGGGSYGSTLTNFFLGLVRTPISDGDIVFKYITSDGTLSGTWAGDGGWGTGISTTFWKCQDIFYDSNKNSYIGFTGTGVGATGDVVVKLDRNGVLVTGWGNNGYVGSSPTPDTFMTFTALTVDSDANLYVARTGSGSGNRSVLVKYDSDGSIDTDFGDNGAIVWTSNQFDRVIPLKINRLVINGDNIYIAGNSEAKGVEFNYNVCAYNKTTGVIDDTWARDGYSQTIDFGLNGDASSMSFDDDDQMYIHVFDTTNAGSLYRLNADGTKDATFNQKFFDVTAPVPAALGTSAGYDSLIDRSGNIWVLFYLNGGFVYRLKKFNPAGDELVSIEVDGVDKRAWCIYSEDDFIYIGATDNWGGFDSLTRYSLAGARDTEFGISLGGTRSPVIMKPSGEFKA